MYDTKPTNPPVERPDGMYFRSVYFVCLIKVHLRFCRNSNGEVEVAKWMGSGQIHRDVEEGRVQPGSKQSHGETCRCSPYSSLCGALLGVSTQQLIL